MASGRYPSIVRVRRPGMTTHVARHGHACCPGHAARPVFVRQQLVLRPARPDPARLSCHCAHTWSDAGHVTAPRAQPDTNCQMGMAAKQRAVEAATAKNDLRPARAHTLCPPRVTHIPGLRSGRRTTFGRRFPYFLAFPAAAAAAWAGARLPPRRNGAKYCAVVE